MKILVDADACPVVLKDMLFRAAKRTGIELLLIANHALRVDNAPNISFLQVSSGFDIADNEIVKRAEKGDLVISGDIPLAAECVDKHATVLSPRGELLDKSNVKSRLNTRDFMETMRASGVQTGGPPPLGEREKRSFAGHLDRYLAQYKR